MTTYAPVPVYADRSRHPRALIAILAAHALAIAAVMSAKMELTSFDPVRTEVKLIPLPPEPARTSPQPREKLREPVLRPVPRQVPLPQPGPPVLAMEPDAAPLPDLGRILGAGPGIDPVRNVIQERAGPRFATPEALIKPPYPQQKLRLEEEAVLRLRLAIDARGRVTAVEPVGSADPAFLAAARRHLIAHWRYRPATEDGRPVASSTVITLRFQLDD